VAQLWIVVVAAMSALTIIPTLIFLLLALGLIVKLIESLLHRHGYDSSPQKVRIELQKILEQDGWRAFDNIISVGPLMERWLGRAQRWRSPVAWVPGASKSWEKLHLK
jgi:hypothetical protein